MNQHSEHLNYKSRRRLYISVLIVDLLFISTGCVMTWPSPVLVKLQLEEAEGSWISATAAIGAVIGPMLYNIAISLLSRKVLLMLNGSVFLIAWIILMFWTSFAGMIVGRFLSGIGAGMSFLCVPLYITEAADVEVRQAVSSLNELYIGMGYLLVYGLGPQISYFLLQMYCSIPSMLFLGLFPFLPESPYYLVSKGKLRLAAKSLSWFRGVSEESKIIKQEIESIQENYKYKKKNVHQSRKLDVITKKGYRKALFLGMFILFTQQMSGISVVASFNQPVLEAANPPFSASIGGIIFAVVTIVTSIFAPVIVRKYGTQKTLISCFYLMALSLITFSVYSYFKTNGVDVKTFNFIPVLALAAFNMFFCIGGGPLPWSLVAELSPAEFRGFNSMIIGSFSRLVPFILLRSWAPVRAIIGDWGIFAIFSCFLTIGATVIMLTLPDTKGLSLAQVQKVLDGEQFREEKDEENH